MHNPLTAERIARDAPHWANKTIAQCAWEKARARPDEIRLERSLDFFGTLSRGSNRGAARGRRSVRADSRPARLTMPSRASQRTAWFLPRFDFRNGKALLGTNSDWPLLPKLSKVEAGPPAGARMALELLKAAARAAHGDAGAGIAPGNVT